MIPSWGMFPCSVSQSCKIGWNGIISTRGVWWTSRCCMMNDISVTHLRCTHITNHMYLVFEYNWFLFIQSHRINFLWVKKSFWARKVEYFPVYREASVAVVPFVLRNKFVFDVFGNPRSKRIHQTVAQSGSWYSVQLGTGCIFWLMNWVSPSVAGTIWMRIPFLLQVNRTAVNHYSLCFWCVCSLQYLQLVNHISVCPIEGRPIYFRTLVNNGKMRSWSWDTVGDGIQV